MINFSDTPCRNCKDRRVGCHTTCQKYKVIQEYSRRERKGRDLDKIYAGDYENDTKRRTHEKIKARNLK